MLAFRSTKGFLESKSASIMEYLPMVRVSKARSGKGEPKKRKVKFGVKVGSEVMTLLNLFLTKHGSVRKYGKAPRGGAVDNQWKGPAGPCEQ